jgi:hypothetical protein
MPICPGTEEFGVCFTYTSQSDNGGWVSIGLLAQRVVADIQLQRAITSRALDPAGNALERAGRVNE